MNMAVMIKVNFNVRVNYNKGVVDGCQRSK